MSEPTQVIVFRNPLEAAIWDSLMNQGGFVVVLVIFCAGIFWALSYDRITNFLQFKMKMPRWRATKYAGWISFILTAVVLYALHFYNTRY